MRSVSPTIKASTQHPGIAVERDEDARLRRQHESWLFLEIEVADQRLERHHHPEAAATPTKGTTARSGAKVIVELGHHRGHFDVTINGRRNGAIRERIGAEVELIRKPIPRAVDPDRQVVTKPIACVEV